MIIKRLSFRHIARVSQLIVACAAFLAGIALAAIGWRIPVWWWLAAPALALCWRRQWWAVVIVAGLSGVAGVWHGGNIGNALQQYRHAVGQKVTVEGMVLDTPSFGGDGQQIMLLQNVHLNGKALPGMVRVKSLVLAKLRRGDMLRASGKLYDGFGNYQASLTYADVLVMQSRPPPLDAMRNWFSARIYSVLPDAQASLGLGFLLGVKSQLSDDTNKQLKTLGLTHIVVASGYNLTVLVRLARRLFERHSRRFALLSAAGMIAGFVTLTGLSSSMSRAALVSGLSLAAWYYGRRVHPLLLILFAAAVTAAANPLYVWNDIGWWLSFLSFAGVLLLAPLVQRKLWGGRKSKLIGQVVLETICAQITTLPLLLLIFGALPVLALPANVIVVPLIPLAMLFTFVAGMCGTVFIFAAWPAIWLLGYITEVVRLMGAIPWATAQVGISPVTMVAIYAALVLLTIILWRRTKYNYLSENVIE